MDNNKDFADKIQYFAAGVLVILSTLVFTVLGAAAVKLLIWIIGLYILIWIIFVLFILILVAISEHEIAKQDEEWLKEEEKKWKKK
jgi:hypothetical protein